MDTFIDESKSDKESTIKAVVRNLPDVVKQYAQDSHPQSPMTITNSVIHNLLRKQTSQRILKDINPNLYALAKLLPFDLKGEHWRFGRYNAIQAVNDFLSGAIQNDMVDAFHHFIHHFAYGKPVEFVACGWCSTVFKSGDYITKIGAPGCPIIPASEIWAQPLVRDVINKERKGRDKYVLELFRKLDTQCSSQKKQNFVVPLRNVARGQGWLLHDSHQENVGFLHDGDTNTRVVPPTKPGKYNHGGFIEGLKPIPAAHIEALCGARIIDLDARSWSVILEPEK